MPPKQPQPQLPTPQQMQMLAQQTENSKYHVAVTIDKVCEDVESLLALYPGSQFVIQYERGRKVTNQGFTPAGILEDWNKPPSKEGGAHILKKILRFRHRFEFTMSASRTLDMNTYNKKRLTFVFARTVSSGGYRKLGEVTMDLGAYIVPAGQNVVPCTFTGARRTAGFPITLTCENGQTLHTMVYVTIESKKLEGVRDFQDDTTVGSDAEESQTDASYSESESITQQYRIGKQQYGKRHEENLRMEAEKFERARDGAPVFEQHIPKQTRSSSQGVVQPQMQMGGGYPPAQVQAQDASYQKFVNQKAVEVDALRRDLRDAQERNRLEKERIAILQAKQKELDQKYKQTQKMLAEEKEKNINLTHGGGQGGETCTCIVS